MSTSLTTLRISQQLRAQLLLDRISYKPGTKFILTPTFKLDCGSVCDGFVIFVSVKQPRLDALGGTVDIVGPVPMDTWMMENMSDAEFYRRIFDAIVQLERHEAEEWFKINGHCMINPHPDPTKT